MIKIKIIILHHLKIVGDSDCAVGWAHFPHTGRCYKHFSEEKLWPDARDFCAREAPGGGGDLVSIPDQATNDFITSLSSDTAWIGASDEGSEDVWKWSDGTPWSYESWGRGE